MAFALLSVSSAFLAFVIVLAFKLFQSTTGKSKEHRSLKKLVSPAVSNLVDQYDRKYKEGVAPGSNAEGRPRWTVKALFIFPIKSCQGIELTESLIISTGVCYDREFSFARYRTGKPDAREQKDRESRWEIMTQRDFPLMAKIKPEIWIPDRDSSRYSPDDVFTRTHGCLSVSFPGSVKPFGFSIDGARVLVSRLRGLIQYVPPTETFTLPLVPTANQIKENGLQSRPMRIWSDKPEAIDLGSMIPPAIFERLRAFIGVEEPFTLFRVDPAKPRQVFHNAPRRDDLGYQPVQSFQDRYPLHLNNLASVHDVSSRLPESFGDLDALRFRSNIYLTGPPAYAEDGWKVVRIGAGVYHVVCRTTRCQLPNVNPSTGTRYPAIGHELSMQPLKVLKTYRAIDEGAKGQPCLGMQMVPAREDETEIRVGDEIQVLESGEHRWL